VSLKRILLWLMPLPLALGALHFALSDRVVPQAESALKAWWDATAPPQESEPRWVQTRDGPASFERSSPDGRRLTGLRIYQRADDGQFALRVTARTATWQDRGWNLEGVEELRVSPDSVRRATTPARRWEANLRPDDVVRLDLSQPHLSSMMLADILRGERIGAQPLRFYQTALYRSFTAPLAAFVMLLLAMPTARMLTRGGAGGGRLLAALGLGLAYLLCDGILAALGTSGRMPPLLAVSLAPASFTLIGLLQLHFIDRS
jgi:lipopolysaccharide export system permease protein